MFFFLIIIGLNILYKRTNHYKEGLSDVYKFKDYIPNNVRIAIIGSNHPKFAFDFKDIGIKGVNWAIGPEAFEYDFIILKKYVSHLAPGAVVVISVCLLSFFLYRFDNRRTYLKYYHFLDKNEFPHYSLRGKIESFFPLLFSPDLIRYIIKDVKISNSYTVEYNPKGTDEELNNDANYWINGWEKQFGISFNKVVLTDKNKSDIAKNVSILMDIVNYCINKGLKPVIAILPITDNLISKFDDSFINIYILDLIKKANNNSATVLNYLQDERYRSSSLYFNSFFFNKVGRHIFTKGFIEDIKKLGLYD